MSLTLKSKVTDDAHRDRSARVNSNFCNRGCTHQDYCFHYGCPFGKDSDSSISTALESSPVIRDGRAG